MKKYKFARISKNYITFTNEVSHHPLWDTLIENPTYKIKNNSIFIKGDEKVYNLGRYVDRDLIDPSEIKIKKFLFWNYEWWTSSWVLMKQRNKYCQIIFNPIINFEGGCE